MSPLKPNESLTICITGAAGQIAYSLLPLLASGNIFGSDQPIELRLLDITPALTVLSGVVMELEDCAYPLLRHVVQTDDPMIAFAHADVAVLAGAFPRRQNQVRSDLLARNANIFHAHGQAMDKVASKNIKAIVVGNPANTNALLLSHSAPSIPHRNFTALTRLDHNRAAGQLAVRTGVALHEIEGVVVWGNHSQTQFPDVSRATARGESVVPKLGGMEAIERDFIPLIQKRGATVIKTRGLSSAMSAARAIGDQLKSWLMGDDNVVSMGVASDGSYGIQEGVYFSFPVRCSRGGEYEIVQGIEIDKFARRYLSATTEELFEERQEALAAV